MTLKDFSELLNTLDYDVAQDEFPLEYDAQCPYIVFEVTGTDNFKADSKVYKKILQIDVSIYSKGHADAEAMESLEELFDNNDIPWDFVGNYDHKGYDYEVVYSVTI